MIKIFKLLFISTLISMSGCNDKPDIAISKDRQLSVFPNPVTDAVFITVDSDQTSTLEVFDTTGEIMLNENVAPGRREFSIALDDRSLGTYHVALKSGPLVITKKFVRYQP